MPDTVRKVAYFSIQVPNKPGQAFKVLSVLVSAGIDLFACTAATRGHRAEINVVPGDLRRFNAAVKKAGLAFTARKWGFLIQGEDRPGALRENLEKLARAEVNVTAIDAVSAGKGRWGAILWVDQSNVRKAARLLRPKGR
ncbi:MAG: hypothetical protein HYU77_00160 [Betaproteobacteria bacterium]|nr:hypothetical protein [Betaproteobacteria bacterium]